MMLTYSKAAIATMCIDFGLFYVLWTSPVLHWFDLAFVCVVLFSHILFYFALYFGEEDLIQTLHILIFLSLAVSIFLENTKLVMISLGVILLIQILCYNKSTDETEFSIAVLLYTVILSIKLGRGTTAIPTQ